MAGHQLQKAMPHDTGSKGSDDEDSGSDDELEDEDVQQRRTRNSKKNGKDNPQTLQYYSGTWKSALHTAKKRFREYVVSTDPFPSRQSDEDVQVATMLLAEVKAEFEANNRMFDPGTTIPLFVNLIASLTFPFLGPVDSHLSNI